MMCYRDMTFCRAWKECKHGDACWRALKDEVLSRAWAIGLPVSEVTVMECFEEKEEDSVAPKTHTDSVQKNEWVKGW